MGITMTENMRGTWWGCTRVPSASPSDAPVSAARGATSSGCLANNPAPVNNGLTNQASAGKGGQCQAL